MASVTRLAPVLAAIGRLAELERLGAAEERGVDDALARGDRRVGLVERVVAERMVRRPAEGDRRPERGAAVAADAQQDRGRHLVGPGHHDATRRADEDAGQARRPEGGRELHRRLPGPARVGAAPVHDDRVEAAHDLVALDPDGADGLAARHRSTVRRPPRSPAARGGSACPRSCRSSPTGGSRPRTTRGPSARTWRARSWPRRPRGRRRRRRRRPMP